MRGIAVEKDRNKVRINTRTWVYVKNPKTPLVEAAAVEVEARKKKRGVYLADTARVQELDLDSEIQRFQRFVCKEGLSLPDPLGSSVENLLLLLFCTGRRALVKRLLSNKSDKLMRFASNPFLLYVYGLTDFHTAKMISMRTMLPASGAEKLQAYLYHILEDAYENGRESVSLRDAVFELSALLDMDEDEVEKALVGMKGASLPGKKRPHTDGQRVYMSWVYFLKRRCLQLLGQNESVEVPAGIEDEQMRALLSWKYTVLTGGPGTGKTTLLKRIKEIIGDGCILSALTGKAAQNFGDGAVTTHAVLGYGSRGFTVKTLDCQVFVVDEASMIDWRTLHAVLKAAPRVIFSGDPSQLPPVEGENVFRQIVEMLPCVRLEKPWRFRDEHGVEVLEKTSERAVFVELAKLVNSLKEKEFQVITPLHGGLLGTEYLNEFLQKTLNPEVKELEGVRKGDRVIVNQNIYTSEGALVVANGTIGKVVDLGKIGEKSYYLVQNGDRKVLLRREHVDLAYALTVHRFQGSEMDYVIFILPDRKKIREGFVTEEMIRVATTRGRIRTYVLEVRS